MHKCQAKRLNVQNFIHCDLWLMRGTYIETIEYFFGDFSNDLARSKRVGDFGAGRNGCGGSSGTVIFQNVDDSSDACSSGL